MSIGEIIFFVICGLIIGFISLILIIGGVDNIFAKDAGTMEVVIEQKVYVPSSTSTGVGPAIGGNGGVAFTTSYSSEKWVLLLKLPNGNFESFQTSKEQWVELKEKQTVSVRYSLGAITEDIILDKIVSSNK